MNAPQPASRGLSPAYFTADREVATSIKELETFIQDNPGWSISDITDQQGHQYVDLVMEGGGMLGIALVGYVYALEKAGIRFLRLGGTSAGSINALLMAAAGPRDEASTDWIIRQLANKNFYDFVDGDIDAKRFIADLFARAKTRLGNGPGAWLRNRVDLAKLGASGLQVIDNLRDHKGLNPGDHFLDWIAELLDEKQVSSIAALKALRRKLPPGGLWQRAENGGPSSEYNPPSLERIAIVAADISTQTKAIFPEMAELYWHHPDQTHPANLVRASMSIPFFFEPFEIKNIPGSKPAQTSAAELDRYQQAWRSHGYMGPIPKQVLFIDGGIMSNFPINLFHNTHSMPEAPTFGVKLGLDRNDVQPTKSFLQLLGAIFDTARTQYDFDFIHLNADYRHLVYCLDVKGFNWLDFDMKPEEMRALFRIGVRGAVAFLQDFQWDDYKELRRKKLEVVEQSEKMESKHHHTPSSLAVPVAI
ncbi:patatin-like phospholipase family protein [Hymenobacter sp. BT188]|uniref:patatin-like phospholipase family protein n=1 Tax=Hymenobacter sp. BT188 TaxID=2763504 RepID=UPI0016513068|nr:patatin-like phospholipase family protein [Hymenobacter sp. BT188]MBC6607069.1 patatin-like phospholipase family protein [Hymenobacter sp. BT188]